MHKKVLPNPPDTATNKIDEYCTPALAATVTASGGVTTVITCVAFYFSAISAPWALVVLVPSLGASTMGGTLLCHSPTTQHQSDNEWELPLTKNNV